MAAATMQFEEKMVGGFKYEHDGNELYIEQCGKVYITRKRELILHCSLCVGRYIDLSTFLDHLISEHYLEEANSSLKPPEYVSVNELNYESRSEDGDCKDKNLDANHTEIEIHDQGQRELVNGDGLEIDESYIESQQTRLKFDHEEVGATSSEEETFAEKSQCKIERKKMFKCNKCEKLFPTLSKWRVHAVTHSEQRKFQCTICNKAFTQNCNLLAHMRRHTDNKRYGCEVCDKRFFTTTEAATHQLRHTGIRPHICSICGRTFLRMYSLTEHMKRHENSRPFACDVCGKRFYSKALLKNHTPTHSNERPFACNVCSTKFSRRCTLREHMKLHTDARQYSCNMCEKSFNQRPALLSHIKINHKVEQAIKENSF